MGVMVGTTNENPTLNKKMGGTGVHNLVMLVSCVHLFMSINYELYLVCQCVIVLNVLTMVNNLLTFYT